MNEKKKELKLVGIIEGTTCSSIDTQKQIDDILKCKIDLVCNGKKIAWEDFYDKTNTEKRALFNAILEDRKMRVDKKTAMANRPLFAVCTLIDNICKRVEYYEGHDKLEKTYDFRSAELENEKLEDYLTEDEYAYDPINFLKQNGLIDKDNEDFTKNILEILHSSNEKELKEKFEKYMKDNK